MFHFVDFLIEILTLSVTEHQAPVIFVFHSGGHTHVQYIDIGYEKDKSNDRYDKFQQYGT